MRVGRGADVSGIWLPFAEGLRGAVPILNHLPLQQMSVNSDSYTIWYQAVCVLVPYIPLPTAHCWDPCGRHVSYCLALHEESVM